MKEKNFDTKSESVFGFYGNIFVTVDPTTQVILIKLKNHYEINSKENYLNFDTCTTESTL